MYQNSHYKIKPRSIKKGENPSSTSRSGGERRRESLSPNAAKFQSKPPASDIRPVRRHPMDAEGGGIGFPPPRLRSLPQNKALPLVRKIVNGFKKNRLRQIEMNHLQLIVKIQIGIKIWTFRGNIGISSLVSAPPNSSPAAGFYKRIDVSLEKWSIKWN